MTDAPERIWAHPTERVPMSVAEGRKGRWKRGKWKDHDSNAHGDVEYIRADVAGKHVEFWRDLGERKDLHGWQPIETAPKDGTLILVYGKGEYWAGQAVVAWSDFMEEWLGTIGDAAGWARIFHGDTQPTDWQPLPEPPK